jgi:CubicO group peptidase (beta-lactamase class C family)
MGRAEGSWVPWIQTLADEERLPCPRKRKVGAKRHEVYDPTDESTRSEAEEHMQIRARVSALAVVTVLTASPSILQGQNLGDDPRVQDAIYLLEQWIDAQRDYEQYPGISIAVVHDQEVIWIAGFGYADLESRRLASPETVYSICSISKLFTSIAAMQLRDEGKFRLNDPVSTLLPWFRIGNPYPDGPAVTVEGLLTHSSGLPNGTGHSEMPPFALPTRGEIIARMPDQETLYPAWQHEHYSNLGLILVGEIVAELSGQSYGDYVTERILRPLGMSSTTPEIGEVQGSERLATGYSAPRRGGGRQEVGPFETHGMAPAMGFASTVEDLAKFASWQFRLLESGSYEMLEANTLREMHRVHYLDPEWETSWGLGFAVSREGGTTFVGHSGFCPGYQSDLILQPDDKIAAIAASNAMIPTWLYTSAAYGLVAPVIRAAQDDPGGGRAIPSEFEKFVGAYDSFPWGGEFQVIPWEGDLAVVRFPSESPRTGFRRLRHIEGNTFRRLEDGDWQSAEYVFELGAQGSVVSMVIDGSPFPRIR